MLTHRLSQGEGVTDTGTSQFCEHMIAARICRTIPDLFSHGASGEWADFDADGATIIRDPAEYASLLARLG